MELDSVGDCTQIKGQKVPRTFIGLNRKQFLWKWSFIELNKAKFGVCK